MNFRILIITWIVLGVVYAIYSFLDCRDEIADLLTENGLDEHYVILTLLLTIVYLIEVIFWPYNLIKDLINTIRS